MSNATTKLFKLYLGLMLVWLGPAELLCAQDPTEVQSKARGPESIETTDYLVPHISTVPATAGDHVELFVRETIRPGRHLDRPAVLMVHGTTQSTVTSFDIRLENYSWMDHLARAGFDVFAMDVTGYGLSPRPMMDDPCNNATSDQQSSLIPKPLAQPCSPSYPFHLTTSQSDWDEIDTVVEYIRQRRGVDKVNLIGWSLGGPRMGGYAARHPEKVDKLLLYAPLYNRLEPSDPPVVLPEPGVPLTVRTISSVFSTWDTQVKCDNQFTPAIRKALSATILEFDPLGKTWGTEDLWRSPVQNTRWGWNANVASQLNVPTLVIRGDLDTQAPAAQVQDLVADIVGVPQKVFVHVACAAHQLVWENQHMILLNASVEWLLHGTFAGQFNGSFAVDKAGQVHQE